MKSIGLIALAAVAAASGIAAEQPVRTSVAYKPAQSTAAEDGWAQESIGKDVAIHSRARSGSAIREFRAIGMIDAPPSAVFAVLDDSEAYP